MKKNNFSLSYFFVLMIIFLLIMINIWYVLFLIPVILMIKKINYLYILSSIVLISFFLIKENYLKEISNVWINAIITKFISSHYDVQTSSMLQLILFGKKIDNFSWETYNIAKNLSIVYLFSIGGYQLSLIKSIYHKLIRNKNIFFFLTSITLLIYIYMLGFSPGALRVFLCFIISMFYKNKKSKYDVIAISGIITLLFIPTSIENYGFIMSYSCTYGIIFIFNLKINSKILKLFLINVVCILISLPIIARMNGVISLELFFYGWFLTSFYCILYIVYFILFLFPFFSIIIISITNCFVWILITLNYLNITIIFPQLNVFFETLYYSILLYSFYIVKSNKEKESIHGLQNI